MNEVKIKVNVLANRAAPINVSLAFGPHSCASTVNATVGAGHLFECGKYF